MQTINYINPHIIKHTQNFKPVSDDIIYKQICKDKYKDNPNAQESAPLRYKKKTCINNQITSERYRGAKQYGKPIEFISMLSDEDEEYFETLQNIYDYKHGYKILKFSKFDWYYDHLVYTKI